MIASDPIVLLLPEADERRRAEARSLVTCLRLLVDAGRAGAAGVVGLSLDRARFELETQGRRRLQRALIDLVRHGLRQAHSGASFFECGEPELERQRAWGVLEEHRDELPWLPEVPDFDESAAQILTRLLEAAERLGLSTAEARVWRARLARLIGGLEASERAWRELLASPVESDVAQAPLREALGGLCETLLDRGAVRAAVHELESRADLCAGDERLARLSSWARTCLGEEVAPLATETLARIPSALAELRSARPDWLARLAGHVGGGRETAGELAAASNARELRRLSGAVLVAVFDLREGGAAELAQVDVAPALRERVDDWRRALEGSCGEVGSPENDLVVRAEVVVVHRAAPGAGREAHASALRRAISSNVRALAFAPLRDGANEVRGWVRFEFEHHLVPARGVLERVGAALELGTDPRPASARGHESESHDRDGARPGGDGACAEALRSLVAELSMKTAQRRWWAFELDGDSLRESCAGGADLGQQRGGGRGLARARKTAALVRWSEPTAELSLAAASASGVVVPIRSAGVLCGFLVVESLRRNDFPDTLTERWTERASSWTALRIARFRDWHRAQHGFDVYFAPESGGHGWVESVFAAARSLAPCALSGAPGSGRSVVARWLQFEGARAQAPIVAGSALTLGSTVREVQALEARARGGVVVLADVEGCSPAAQLALLDLWETRREARWVLTLSDAPSALAASGSLRPELARRLERLHLRVPSLSERRVELPRLVHAILRRCAVDEGVAMPSLEDEALALLWRQPWGGNVRELENLLFKLVLAHPGRSVGREEVERIAKRSGLELLRRASSRQPDPELVRAALATTANLRGTINKTRAALYLGWDPDTLVSRMAELSCAAPASVAEASASPDDL
jgi:hypothetical protein